MGSSQSVQKVNLNNEVQRNCRLASDYEVSVQKFRTHRFDDGFYFICVNDEHTSLVYDAHVKASHHYRIAGKIPEANMRMCEGIDASMFSTNYKLIEKCANDSELYGLICMGEEHKWSDNYAFKILVQSILCYIVIGNLEKVQQLLKIIESMLNDVNNKLPQYHNEELEIIIKIIDACNSRNVEEFTKVCLLCKPWLNLRPLIRPNMMKLCKQTYEMYNYYDKLIDEINGSQIQNV